MIKDKDVKIEEKDIKNLTPSITGGVFCLTYIYWYEDHYNGITK